jgi:nucleoid DNA-binding protein/DNA-directed RNA polymerase subunit RPC12/RpoP
MRGGRTQKNNFLFGVGYDKNKLITVVFGKKPSFREYPLMSAPYLKANLISELATVAGISKRKTDVILGQIVQIAYREARTGFTLPGICKLDVVHRNARRARIPRTGEQIIIGAHDSLRVRLLRKAKHAVTPMHPGLVQYVRAEAISGDVAVEPPPSADAALPIAPNLQPNNNEGMVSFRCAACGQEMEAPFDMAGTASDCPACSGIIEVPFISEPGTIWGAPLTDVGESDPSSTGTPLTEEQVTSNREAMKSRTIRIELPDDI